MILVTGGSGFVGTHIVRALAEAGPAVVAYSDAPLAEESRAYLAPVAARVIDAAGDTLDGDRLGAILRAHRVRTIVHAAAINGEPNCRRDPVKAALVNVQGTATVFDAAARAGVGRVVYIGSGSQWGARTDLTPIAETEPTAPAGVYAATKEMAEHWGREFAKLRGLEFASVRLSAPYGPCDRIGPTPTHVQFWLQAALDGREINLAAGADHPRDFIFAPEAGRGIALVATAPRLPSSVYNMGGGRSRGLGEIVAIVRKLKPGCRLSIGPGWLTGDIPYGAARGPLDMSRARAELGFAPAVDLEAGIGLYLEWLERRARAR